jgi:GNAT superfamily N-acetyltransferase
MEIHRLTEDDLEPLAALYKQFWGETSSLDAMHTTFARLQANPNYLLLGAKRSRQLVGSAMGIICEELYGECKPFMVVEDVIVDKAHRRKSIGSVLMRELEQHAADAGCSYIIFVTESERADAHRFYDSLGYESDAYRGFKKRLNAGQHPTAAPGRATARR